MTALVRDQMITLPKTLPVRVSVDEARSALADGHVHLLLLTEGRTLRGTLTRADLPTGAPEEGPALWWSTLSGLNDGPDADAARSGAADDDLQQGCAHGDALRRLVLVPDT